MGSVRSAITRPWAQVLIFADRADSSGTAYDVTADCIDLSVSLNIDTMHTWTLTLNNMPKGKWINRFTPFDRIVITAGRTKDETSQILTGYVAKIPQEQMYVDDNIMFSGYCVMHKVSKKYWNPYLDKWLAQWWQMKPDQILHLLLEHPELGNMDPSNVIIEPMSQALNDRWDALTQIYGSPYTYPSGVDSTPVGGLEVRGVNGSWLDSQLKPPFAGLGTMLSALAQKYNIPWELVLGITWMESQNGTTGASVRWNNPGNLTKGSENRGEIGTDKLAGNHRTFTVYPSMAVGLEAMFKTLNTSTYRSMLNAGDLAGVLNRWVGGAAGAAGGNTTLSTYTNNAIKVANNWRSKATAASAYTTAGAQVKPSSAALHDPDRYYGAVPSSTTGTAANDGPVNGMWAPTGPLTSGFSNTWGESRKYRATPSNPNPTHKGTDLLGKVGDPIYAVVPGVIVDYRVYGNLEPSGNIMYLKGDNGYIYAYMHLDSNVVPKGTRVVGGQLIARMGRTSTIKNMVPHLHFQIHPGGQIGVGAVNPYPYLTPLYNSDRKTPIAGPGYVYDSWGAFGAYGNVNPDRSQPPVDITPWATMDRLKQMNESSLLAFVREMAACGYYRWCTNGQGQAVFTIPDYLDESLNFQLKHPEVRSFTKKAISDDDYITHVYVVPDLDNNGNKDLSYDWFAGSLSPASTIEDEFNQQLVSRDTIMSKAGFTDGKSIMEKIGHKPISKFHKLLRSLPQAQMMSDWYFREYWLMKYAATAQLTFMPMIRPMMRVGFEQRGWSYYVEQVTHTMFSNWTTSIVCTAGIKQNDAPKKDNDLLSDFNRGWG